MEEDIENLQEIITLSKEEIANNDANITAILDLADLKSLQNLITGYKQLEEENRTLKRVNKMTEDISIEDITQVMNKAYEDFMKEFIPKSKIKEKIEELDERIKNPERTSYWASYTISECIGIRRILQELLEEE
mgnify:CR=1 FL=1